MALTELLFDIIGRLPCVIVLSLGMLVIFKGQRWRPVLALWIAAAVFLMAMLTSQNHPPTFPSWLIWSAMWIAAADLWSIWNVQSYERSLQWVSRKLLRTEERRSRSTS